MLNNSHRQTTAYHPESNGAVERRHCHLNDALSTRGDLVRGVTFCAPQTLGTAEGRHWSFPGSSSFWRSHCVTWWILQNEEISVDTIIKNFSKTLDVPAVSLPRHNSSTQLHSELPAELLSAPLVWVCHGGVVPLYDSPYTVLRRGPGSFTIWVGSRDQVIAVSHLKACTAADAEPGSPCRCSRLPGSRPGGPAATKRVSFSARWYLHLPLRCRLQTVREPVSYPARRFLHTWDQRRHHRCHRCGTRPVNGPRHRDWTSDLFSIQPRPEFGGSPVDICLHPWSMVRPVGCTPVVVPCTVPVYILLCNCHLTSAVIPNVAPPSTGPLFYIFKVLL